MNILILNGSPSGNSGNCGEIIKLLKRPLKGKSVRTGKTAIPDRSELHWETVHLAHVSYNSRLIKKIETADAFLFITGTYWDSWGSPMQKFLEEATGLEADPRVVGKPAGVIVLKHSVGGKGVLSRLQGVLSSFGFLLPPFSGMTLSLASQLATSTTAKRNQHADDFWGMDDIDVIIENLQLAAKQPTTWKVWPVDRKNFRKTWVK